MAEEQLASEEQVEQARDTMAEEALIAFFAAQMLMDGDEGDGPELALAVERWATRGARRLFELYYLGMRNLGFTLRQGGDTVRALDRDLRQSAVPDSGAADGLREQTSSRDSTDFTPSPETLRKLSQTVKAMRHSIRAHERAEARDLDPGRAITPEAASRAVANEAHGLISIEMAEKVGFALPEGLTLNKTWLSRQDLRVRELHERLDGRTRKLGEDFWRWPQTGQALAFPGDPRAPLDATANCRCFLVLSIS